MNRIAALGVITAVVVALPGCGSQPSDSSASPGPPPLVAPSGDPPAGFANVVEQISPSVVTVQADGSLGSGVVLRPDVVVTNAHVVGTHTAVTVAFADGATSPGRVLAADTVTDLAVVRTDRATLPVPSFRTDLPRRGEISFAIGSPLGFQNTVTAGIISGLHRDIPGSARLTSPLVDLIQTDASISPGNSGGALLDVNGRVVGINEAYIPPEVGAVAIGFAIPSATVLAVTDQLLTSGRAVHPYLGLSLGQLTPAIQRQLGVTADRGALVLGVDAGSPGDNAGIRPGDVVVEFAGERVDSIEDLLGALRHTRPGSRQSLVVTRGGERIDTSVTIGSRTG
ncbi:MAG: trypsin-like peptidase domain-containing protein [Actinomycetota bacterium]|nr:trypsin-like peptidase domain-containing protein [Actinomycetota bacterium]